MATTWRMQDAETLRAEDGIRWATYDIAGNRLKAGQGMCALTADELAACDAAAPAEAAKGVARSRERAAERAAAEAPMLAGAVRAAFAGRGFRRGDWIVNRGGQWVPFVAAAPAPFADGEFAADDDAGDRFDARTLAAELRAGEGW